MKTFSYLARKSQFESLNAWMNEWTWASTITISSLTEICIHLEPHRIQIRVSNEPVLLFWHSYILVTLSQYNKNWCSNIKTRIKGRWLELFVELFCLCCTSVFLLFLCSPLKVDMFPYVLVFNPDLLSLNRFLNSGIILLLPLFSMIHY